MVKYFFNKNKDTYITVTPSAGDYIPGELEERVFIALMQIMKEKNMPRKFMVTGTELRNKLKLNTIRYGNIIKNALLRLSETNYNFKNTMYSSDKNGTIKEEVSTPILMLKIITLSKKENISFRDFIIRQIPELSCEGDERAAFIKINDFKTIKKEKDELNENKEKIVVGFYLPKGCYATVLVDYLFRH